MNVETTNKLYKKCKAKGFQPKHVCEVGVHLPPTSNIINFINEGIKTTLVEPDPKSIDAINTFFAKNTNIVLHPVAIFDYNGQLELAQRGPSTFVSTLTASPSLVNDKYTIKEEDKFTVKCVQFHEVDDGTIELLSVDTEGCEWYTLKDLVSRPSVISLETHGKYYTNAFITEILNWMRGNNYVVWYKDGSDTVFIKNGLFGVSIIEKIQLFLRNLRIRLVKMKQFFK